MSDENLKQAMQQNEQLMQRLLHAFRKRRQQSSGDTPMAKRPKSKKPNDEQKKALNEVTVEILRNQPEDSSGHRTITVAVIEGQLENRGVYGVAGRHISRFLSKSPNFERDPASPDNAVQYFAKPQYLKELGIPVSTHIAPVPQEEIIVVSEASPVPSDQTDTIVDTAAVQPNSSDSDDQASDLSPEKKELGDYSTKSMCRLKKLAPDKIPERFRYLLNEDRIKREHFTHDQHMHERSLEDIQRDYEELWQLVKKHAPLVPKTLVDTVLERINNIGESFPLEKLTDDQQGIVLSVQQEDDIGKQKKVLFDQYRSTVQHLSYKLHQLSREGELEAEVKRLNVALKAQQDATAERQKQIEQLQSERAQNQAVAEREVAELQKTCERYGRKSRVAKKALMAERNNTLSLERKSTVDSDDKKKLQELSDRFEKFEKQDLNSKVQGLDSEVKGLKSRVEQLPHQSAAIATPVTQPFTAVAPDAQEGRIERWRASTGMRLVAIAVLVLFLLGCGVILSQFTPNPFGSSTISTTGDTSPELQSAIEQLGQPAYEL